jgi:acyl-coenzyme A synthetase/AMP-(fatty) acid ligase
MPDPIRIVCHKDVWTPVALDQIMGYLYPMDKRPSMYLYTSRMTGNPAPTERSEGVPIFTNKDYKFIIALDAIDLYVMAVGADGAVRYDWTY